MHEYHWNMKNAKEKEKEKSQKWFGKEKVGSSQKEKKWIEQMRGKEVGEILLKAKPQSRSMGSNDHTPH